MHKNTTEPVNLTVADTEEKLFDLSLIRNVCRDNQAAIHKMIQVFLQTVPATVEEMKASLQAADYTRLQQLAHRVKPSLAMYAIITLEKEINRIDRMSAEPVTVAELDAMLEKAEKVISQVSGQLHQIINR